MSAPSEIGSNDGSEIDAEVFGPLATIPEDDLIALASRIGSQVLRISTNNAKIVKRVSGSYNIVHIIELEIMKLVIRVPATGWGAGMTKTAADALASQVAVMRLVRQKTKAPVPEIYDWDPTNNNEIGAPFICMAFLPGETASHVWFDQSNGTEAREERRLNILTSLSNIMAQFDSISFDKIGSITAAEDGSFSLGPIYHWLENDDGSIQVTADRTYFSTMEFLACNMRFKDAKDSVWGRAESKMLETLIQNSPDLDSYSRFVLCPPDLDSQNVLVDDKGNVTGIIDWDLCRTMPPHLGYASYPGWITRDWDPLMYGWPFEQEYEDSPETLQRYRAHYNKKLGKALSWRGDWRFTENSHVAEAVWIAMLNSTNRMDICRKFVEVALELENRSDAIGVLYEIGENEYDEQSWGHLEKTLKLLVCPPATPSQAT
jgi:aminoglycoside phosphotransferase (APT) family kinase protein